MRWVLMAADEAGAGMVFVSVRQMRVLPIIY